MKMIYQTKHTKQNFSNNSHFKKLAIFLAILVLALALNIFSPVRSLVSKTLSPFFTAGNFFYDSLSLVPKFFSDKSKLVEENKKLLDELESNRLDTVSYESIKYENQKLREELRIKPAGEFVAASITARSPQIPLDSLFLDKGTEEGVNNGDLVLAGERILIGKITEVFKNKAVVALDSFAEAHSYGYVARTDEPIEIKGGGGGSIEAKVPIDFDIAIGDEIMVGGSTNLLAAIVGSIEEDHSSGFKNVLMSLPVNVSKIGIVFIRPLISE